MVKPEVEPKAEPNPQERLTKIQEEEKRHAEALETIKHEVAKLQNGLRLIKDSQNKKVDQILENFFLEDGDQKALDRVFKAEMITPQTR
jgi:hypothetical protein